MKIVVLANDIIFETMMTFNQDINWVKVADANSFSAHTDAIAFFDLTENAINNEHPLINKPLFLHSVFDSLPVGKKAIRMNAWNGFLENSTWEVAGETGGPEKEILSILNKKMIACADEPGFISARIIAMIINEAYFAKEENVSTETEIDTAMKLGTNYLYGPFEWAQKIGIKNIYLLLKHLSLQDSRYTPAPLLTKMATG